jgi:hypothetical protein
MRGILCKIHVKKKAILSDGEESQSSLGGLTVAKDDVDFSLLREPVEDQHVGVTIYTNWNIFEVRQAHNVLMALFRWLSSLVEAIFKIINGLYLFIMTRTGVCDVRSDSGWVHSSFLSSWRVFDLLRGWEMCFNRDISRRAQARKSNVAPQIQTTVIGLGCSLPS